MDELTIPISWRLQRNIEANLFNLYDIDCRYIFSILIQESDMANMGHRTAKWIMNMILSGILLPPNLALVKAFTPLPVPWIAVFIPWIGLFHLALCCFAARIIARILSDLMHVRS